MGTVLLTNIWIRHCPLRLLRNTACCCLDGVVLSARWVPPRPTTRALGKSTRPWGPTTEWMTVPGIPTASTVLPTATVSYIFAMLGSKDCKVYMVRGRAVVKSRGFGIRLPYFKTCLCHLLAGWPWASFLTSLCLSSLVYKMGGMRTVPTHRVVNEDYMSVGRERP